jgi:hypothetical protein
MVKPLQSLTYLRHIPNIGQEKGTNSELHLAAQRAETNNHNKNASMC